jgi:DNA mismatch endonuclease (patch repair protein)
MADVHTPEQRSYNMSQVRSKNTKPELIVRKFLFAQGFRYRLHDKKLPGKPDVVLPKYKTAILIHGCFYHGHNGCRYFVIPKTRTAWWLDKINSNRRRDEENYVKLTEAGWRIITIYECELKPAKREETLHILLKKLNQTSE